MLVQPLGKEYDEGGNGARSGFVNEALLQKLNALDYYRLPAPKSLANSFGTDEVFPLVQSFQLSTEDALRTYVEHVVQQVAASARSHVPQGASGLKLLATGGGAFNTFMIERLAHELQPLGVEVIVPSKDLVQYKEALIMALMGVLRWRQEYNVLSSVTGAVRDSIGGAVWIGQEA
jgi:anhydro-N-acetylmuramic acid kinase